MASKIVLAAFLAVATVKSAFNVFGVPQAVTYFLDEREGR